MVARVRNSVLMLPEGHGPGFWIIPITGITRRLWHLCEYRSLSYAYFMATSSLGVEIVCLNYRYLLCVSRRWADPILWRRVFVYEFHEKEMFRNVFGIILHHVFFSDCYTNSFELLKTSVTLLNSSNLSSCGWIPHLYLSIYLSLFLYIYISVCL